MFRPLDLAPSVWVAERKGLRCAAISLGKKKVCVYNPVAGLGKALKAFIDSTDQVVSDLVTPNHYHNKALSEYMGVFPDATLRATGDAIPRLKKVSGLQFVDVHPIQDRLPSNIQLLYPPGLKTGEVWLQVTYRKRILWIVGDAFCGVSPSPDSSELQLLKAFPKFGVFDAQVYDGWVRKTVKSVSLKSIVPCHGSIVETPGLPKKAVSLVSTLTR